MAGTSIAWPVTVAIAAALNGDALVAALLAGDRVYNTVAPKDADLDYVVLSTPSERELWLFMRGASSASMMLHAYTKGRDNKSALVLYGEMHRVLNRASLVVTGFGSFVGELRLIDVLPDPDGQSMHLAARYEFTAIRVG